jgi:hypothetical protein
MDNMDNDLIEAANTLLYLSKKQCEICNAVNTPLWRRTEKYAVLCNRCGIRERTKCKSTVTS